MDIHHLTAPDHPDNVYLLPALDDHPTNKAKMYSLRTIRQEYGATKVHHFQHGKFQNTSSYTAGKFFRAYNLGEPDDIYELSETIADTEDYGDRFIIRGKPRRNLRKGAKVNRQCRDHHEHPSWQEQPRSWLMIDIDDVNAPPWFDEEDDLDQGLLYLLATLPDGFQNVTTYYQWSSSMGVGSWQELSAHFWFMIDRPLLGQCIKNWLADIADIDCSVYNPVQPHYVANPIFVGADDPLDGQRTGMLEFDQNIVKVPDEIMTPEQYQETLKRDHSYDPDKQQWLGEQQRHKYVLGALRSACNNISMAGCGQRNNTLFKETASLAGFIATKNLDEDTLKKAMIEAGMAAGLPKMEAKRTVKSGIRSGIASPRYIEDTEAARIDEEVKKKERLIYE